MRRDHRELEGCMAMASWLFLSMAVWAGQSTIAQTLHACAAPLLPNPEYCVVKRPLSVATGDLDGDGYLDLVAPLQFGPLPETVAILFGCGDGTFGDPVTYDGGFEPFDVAIADLDDDGDLDLVVLDAGGHNLGGALPGKFRVLLNDGDGIFFVHQIHILGVTPQSIALGDLDGDGDLDLAVAVTGADIVETFRNNGDATFVFTGEFPTDGPQAIDIGDLNDDGLGDLVVANRLLDAVSVWINNGNGTFGQSITYDCGVRPISVAIGDLDGDGDPDLAVGNFGSSFDHGTTVSILRNNGLGIFSAPMPFDVGESPTCVHLADLDNDSDLDLAVTNLWSDDVSLLLNNGDATFAPQLTASTGFGPYAVTSGDFDGDGDLDLAAANCFGDTLSVLLNHGDGSFQDVTSFDVGAEPTALAIGDLNDDGAPDLAVAHRGTDSNLGGVSILLNLGNGSFTEQVSFDTGYAPEAVVMGDLDGDGDNDLAVANFVTSNVSILLNRGDGSFDDHVTYPSGSGPQDMAIGDLDGDHDLDLAVANANGGDVSILLNNGDGTFADHVTYPVNGGDFSLPFAIVLGDVDGDQDLDFVTANIKPFNVSVMFNQGDGTFADEVLYPFFLPQSVALADLDGDNDVDLIVLNQFIWVSLNDGHGNFAAPTSYEACFGAFFVRTADMDGDLDLDLVVKDRSNTIGILLNNGDATFDRASFFRVGSEPTQLAVGDLNHDGAMDVVVANLLSNNVSVLMNGLGAAAADLDGDGDIDLNDFALFLLCVGGPQSPPAGTCPPGTDADLDNDEDVDSGDFALFQLFFTGALP